MATQHKIKTVFDQKQKSKKQKKGFLLVLQWTIKHRLYEY